MADLPSLDALSRVDRGVVFALMAEYGDPANAAEYEFRWERDRALHDAVDRAAKRATRRTIRNPPPAPAPRWLRGIIDRELKRASATTWAQGSFNRIRRFERAGLIDLEPDDTYVLAMVSGLADIASTLRDDPDLVGRAFWRLFEVEGGGEVSLTNVDRFGRDRWRKAVLELTADGTLDRNRVLDCCLRALRRDFIAYRAGWYSATFLALEPTDEEVATLQPGLRPLLASALPATVAFAVRLLLRLQKAGRLDVEAALEALAPATLVKTKGTALDALRIARAAAPDHHRLVAAIARTALGHHHADVQRTAAELLDATGDGDEVVAAADDLAPGVRHDLGFDAASVPAGARPQQSLLPVPTGVSDAELAEVVAGLLEDASDVSALEGALASLARPGSEDALAPLRTRARTVATRDSNDGTAWLPGQLARTVLDLLGEPIEPAPARIPAVDFVIRRLGELRDGDGPLLATPDLPGGWVSPGALSKRLASTRAPRHHDLIAALLRLHPDGRRAVDPSGLPAAVSFALNGAEVSERPGPASWWLAARRSRAPYGPAEAPTLRGELSEHTWTEKGRKRSAWYAHFIARGAAATSPSEEADDQPTELAQGRGGYLGGVHEGYSWSGLHLGAWVPTLAAIWPHDAEHFLVLTCSDVLESANWAESAHDVPRTLDALARHPGRLGPLAAATLAGGLSAAKREHRLHATDAFVDLVASGRMDADSLAAVMAQFVRAWPTGRWVECLGNAAQAPGAGPAVIDLLTVLLPQLGHETRGLSGLLELLRDETLRQGAVVRDSGLRTWLGGFSGSSRASRTAKVLLG